MTPIEQIKERLNIVDIIGVYISLQKSGNSYKGKCPFHNEKTPSFFVSPDRQGFYCFGCAAKGDIFSFVEKFEGLDFKGALKVLADKAGISLGEYEKNGEEKDILYACMEKATQFFENNLNTEAKSYLKSRGLSDKTIKDFRIGFVKEEWRSLKDFFAKENKTFTDEILVKCGLIKKSEKGYYDTFRGRIIFPITDSSGRVIAFTGRILKDDGKSAKYLNSPDTVLYDKSNTLYGLEKAKIDIRTKDYSILVEGQMDLIVCHQEGFKNVIAVSGTAFTEKHADILRRYSQNIIMSFDSDNAGKRAAIRASEIALGKGMDVKVLSIVGGKDPADILIKEKELWINALKNAKPVIYFELEEVLEEEKDQRKIPKLIRERVFPFFKYLASSMDRSTYISYIHSKTGLSENSIREDLDELRFESRDKKSIAIEDKNEQNKAGEKIPKKELIMRELFGFYYLDKMKKEIESSVDGFFLKEKIMSDFKNELMFIIENKNYEENKIPGIVEELTMQLKEQELLEKLEYFKKESDMSGFSQVQKALHDLREKIKKKES